MGFIPSWYAMVDFRLRTTIISGLGVRCYHLRQSVLPQFLSLASAPTPAAPAAARFRGGCCRDRGFQSGKTGQARARAAALIILIILISVGAILVVKLITKRNATVREEQGHG